MTDQLKVYVGYDSREDIAWQVCRHSLLRHAGADVPVFPLKQQSVRELGLYTRSTDKASTEFSLTRFLTPYIAAHDGWSVFVDCDFLFTTDIMKVLDGVDRSKAIYVVQHDYTPSQTVKMDGQTQTSYPRKNWSSFMLFNNAHPAVKALTPEVVNREGPAYLHRFSWISDDAQIGGLPLSWNFLSGEYPKPAETPSAIHYTNGGPWFSNWQNVDFADLWCAERDLYQKAIAAKEAV
jgi:lipopolysaccharide biosynthesis glycosyltransferase